MYIEHFKTFTSFLGLYGKDNLEMGKIDATMDTVSDLAREYAKALFVGGGSENKVIFCRFLNFFIVLV